MATHPGKRLGVCGQHGRRLHVQREGALQIRKGLIGTTQLEVGQPAVHPGLNELGIEIQCLIIGREGFRQPAASRKGESAVQLRPGELGYKDRAETEVRGCIGMSPLIAVADTKGEPGPELA